MSDRSGWWNLSGGRIALIAQHGLSHGLAVAGADGTTRTVVVPLTSIKPYLASELRARDSRHEGLFFDGVGHYLSAPETLAGALAAEPAFYRGFLS